MVRVPTRDERRVSTIPDQTRFQRANPAINAATGVGTARAGQRLGSSVTGTASAIADQELIDLAEKNNDDARRLALSYEEAERQILYGEDGFLTKQGTNAVDGQQEAIDRLSMVRDKILAPKNGNERVRQLVKERLDKLMQNSKDVIARHASVQRGQVRIGNAEALVQNHIDEAGQVYNDPEALQFAKEKLAVDFNALANIMGYGGEQKAEEFEKALDLFHRSAATGFLSSNTLNGVSQAKAYVSQQKDELSAPTRKILNEQIDRTENRIKNDLRDQFSKQVLGLKKRIFEGDILPTEAEQELDRLQSAGAMTDSQYFAIKGDILKMQQVATNRAINDALMSNVLNSTSTLDRTNTDHKKVQDAHFGGTFLPSLIAEQNSRQLSGNPMTMDEFNSQIVDYSVSSGRIPSMVQSQIIAANGATDTQTLVDAANLYSQLGEANSQLLHDFSTNEVEKVALVADLLGHRFSDAKAVEMANEALSVDQTTRDFRNKALTKGGADSILNKSFAEFVDDFGEEEVPDRLRGEFRELFTVLYESNGNEETSYKLALQQLQKHWAKTEVGSQEVWQEDAPEKRYGLPSLSDSENAEWIEEQLTEELVREGKLSQKSKNKNTMQLFPTEAGQERSILTEPGVAPSSDDVKNETLDSRGIHLVPHVDSRRMRRPTYYVFETIEGVPTPIMDDATGEPLQFRPDWETSPENSRRQEEIRKLENKRDNKLKAAKKDREALKKRHEEGLMTPKGRTKRGGGRAKSEDADLPTIGKARSPRAPRNREQQ